MDGLNFDFSEIIFEEPSQFLDQNASQVMCFDMVSPNGENILDHLKAEEEEPTKQAQK